MGVDSWWHDGGEGPEAGNLYDGSYAKCHNLLDLFRERLWYEKLRQEFPDRRVAIRCRTTFAGAHRYGVMLQPGDMMSGIETLKVQVLRTLSSALSGFPFRGPDMGGHYPDVDADLVLTGRHTFEGTVSQEVFLRWVQFCAFNSIMWSHGQFWRSKLPWMRGPKVEAIVKKYIELRYRLIPYIYSSVWATCTTGAPFMRALVLDYPGDANVTDLSTQYMFGQSLLVAPVLKEASTSWDVYLPEGMWYDFWTSRAYDGGRWVSVRVDLETMPIFVKAGSIIPMGPVMQYVTEKALDPITLLVYPSGRSESVLYEDDGETYGYEAGEFALTRYACEVDETGVITITLGKPEGSFDGQVTSRDYILRIHSPEEPREVTVAGNVLSTDVAAPDHWSYEGQNTLMVKMSGVADRVVVVVSYADVLAM
jgi:alpha-glucosidase (family GH31 glycosyl hydrolase)